MSDRDGYGTERPGGLNTEIVIQSHRLPRGVRIADVTTCVLLLLINLCGAVAALVSFIALPMSTDNCAYQACGDEKWIRYAIWLVLGSMAPAGLFSVLGLIQLVRNRIAFWLLLIGAVAQWSLIIAGWRVAGLAGPIAG